MPRKIIILIILIVLFLLCVFSVYFLFCRKKGMEEQYDTAILQKEKTIDAQNLFPSNQSTEKKDFMNLIQRIKKYIEGIPLKKIKLPVYYINMDKNPERKEFMENQLRHYSDRFTRIKGFNGYKIQNKSYDTVEGVTFRNRYIDLTNSEIGCLMSHLLAIKKAYEDGNDIALILEDDTVVHLMTLLEHDFETIYQDAPNDWEIINLFHMSNWKTNLLKTTYNRNQEYKYLKHDGKINYLYSAVGYLINRKGMKKILDFAYDSEKNMFDLGKDFRIAPNGRADFFIYDITNSYYLYPDLFYPNNLALESTLHMEHTDAHIKRSLEVLKYYDNKIKRKEFNKKYNIVVVYSNLSRRKDLDDEMKKQLSIFPKVERVESQENFDYPKLAILNNHINMLKKAVEYGKDALVCEDDISIDSVNIPIFLYDFYEKKIDWDVLMFVHASQQMIPTLYKDLKRTYEAKINKCYLIRAGYIPTLLKVLEESLIVYKTLGFWNDMTNPVDESWKSLQKIDKWYVPVFNPPENDNTIDYKPLELVTVKKNI